MQEFFEGLQTEGERMSQAIGKQAERQRRTRLLRQANNALYKLSSNVYHESVPLDDINSILSAAEFEPLDAVFVCGRDGRIHEPVGYDRWLLMTWHKMESGRYEIVAYIS